MQKIIRPRLILAAGLLSFPLLFCNDARAAVTPITECQTIQQPGKYHLRQDLQGSDTCLEVVSNDVELHLDGYTIRSVTGVRVINASNVSITGSGTIEAQRYGIFVHGGTETKIVDVTIQMTSDESAGQGVRLESTRNATVIGNTILSIGATRAQRGILVAFNGDSIVRSNNVSGFAGGIHVAGNTGNLYQANTASGNEIDILNAEGCGLNTWKSNTYTTFSGLPCIQ